MHAINAHWPHEHSGRAKKRLRDLSSQVLQVTANDDDMITLLQRMTLTCCNLGWQSRWRHHLTILLILGAGKVSVRPGVFIDGRRVAPVLKLVLLWSNIITTMEPVTLELLEEEAVPVGLSIYDEKEFEALLCPSLLCIHHFTSRFEVGSVEPARLRPPLGILLPVLDCRLEVVAGVQSGFQLQSVELILNFFDQGQVACIRSSLDANPVTYLDV
mmetsp:Transcript_22451/g.40523  ORF Transcript_22451/g.40523 Transcript_22451/m.40523 type:complete len:215 (-) Transcript_22451:916-1560(-)